MSIRHGLLALLDQGPRYGYQLRTEFEARAGATWPLNVGQVYTTLSRLERDGLVEPAGEDDEGHQFYAATDAGREELRTWFDTPVPRTDKRCEVDHRYSSTYSPLTADDANLLRNLYGVTDQGAGHSLAAGKAVVFHARYLKDGKVTFPYSAPVVAEGAVAARSKPVYTEIAVDAVLAEPSLASPAQAVISPATAARLGFSTTPTGSVWLPAAAPSDGAQQKADGALAKLSERRDLLKIERGYESESSLVRLGLNVFAGIVALGAAGIATGLAAADSQRDLTTLAAVGAEPRVRRSLSGFQCGVIAAMGALLGVVCGVVPGVALRKVEAAASSYPGMSPEELANKASLVFPWPTLAATVLLLPVLAAALAALMTRSRITLLRRSG